MAVERYYFRRLNVSLWQTSHFLCMLIGFHTSLIDMHTKKPFIPDLLLVQKALGRSLCVNACMCVSVRVRTFEDVIIRKESTLSWWCCSNSFTGLWLPEHR